MSINFPVCESPSGWKSNGKSLECIGIKKYQLFEVECIGFIGESIKDKPLGFFDKLFFSHFFSKKLKDNKDHTLFYESLKNGELDTKKDIPIDKIFKEKMK